MATDLADLRREYTQRPLTHRDVAPDPIEQFEAWFEQATAADVPDVNAMSLATSTAHGRPSCRIVLLKEVDDHGFLFYTNYASRKGRELEENPYAALTIYWNVLDRQVRVEGRVERVAPEVSDAYFARRPRESQLGAWASEQSSVVSGREELEARLHDLERRFDGKEVARPAGWGGYRVRPEAVEFWQGRPGRLHDRLRYQRTEERWTIERLAP